MAKSVKSLTGPEKDAYLRRALAAESGVSPAAAARVAKRLEKDVTRVWVRANALEAPTSDETSLAAAKPVPGKAAASFDPYSPNIVVVLRKSGREQVLEALSAIRQADQLRLLAREQQLGIAQNLTTLDEIRLAILAAAERRVANRRAAGS